MLFEHSVKKIRKVEITVIFLIVALIILISFLIIDTTNDTFYCFCQQLF